MKLFGLVFALSVFAFGVVMMRIEINRSGREIGRLQNEVEIKRARNQYLELEAIRLESPQTVRQLSQETLHLRRTPPQQVIVLED